MNREIKFRAWDEGNKVMHLNFQFFTSGDGGNDWICFSSDKEPRDTKTVQHGIVFSNPYFRQQFKIMQFTSLLDKNGNQIYEGDVLTAGDGGIFEVKFEYAGFHFCTTPSSKYISYPAPCGNASRMEVIGNRYENPDLLEGLKC